MAEHGWTRHGHRCCDMATGPRPALVARCGGPGLCKNCSVDQVVRHAPDSGPIRQVGGLPADTVGPDRQQLVPKTQSPNP